MNRCNVCAPRCDQCARCGCNTPPGGSGNNATTSRKRKMVQARSHPALFVDTRVRVFGPCVPQNISGVPWVAAAAARPVVRRRLVPVRRMPVPVRPVPVVEPVEEEEPAIPTPPFPRWFGGRIADHDSDEDFVPNQRRVPVVRRPRAPRRGGGRRGAGGRGGRPAPRPVIAVPENDQPAAPATPPRASVIVGPRPGRAIIHQDVVVHLTPYQRAIINQLAPVAARAVTPIVAPIVAPTHLQEPTTAQPPEELLTPMETIDLTTQVVPAAPISLLEAALTRAAPLTPEEPVTPPSQPRAPMPAGLIEFLDRPASRTTIIRELYSMVTQENVVRPPSPVPVLRPPTPVPSPPLVTISLLTQDQTQAAPVTPPTVPRYVPIALCYSPQDLFASDEEMDVVPASPPPPARTLNTPMPRPLARPLQHAPVRAAVMPPPVHAAVVPPPIRAGVVMPPPVRAGVIMAAPPVRAVQFVPPPEEPELTAEQLEERVRMAEFEADFRAALNTPEMNAWMQQYL